MPFTISKNLKGSLKCPVCENGTLQKTNMKAYLEGSEYRKCAECGSRFYVHKLEHGQYEVQPV